MFEFRPRRHHAGTRPRRCTAVTGGDRRPRHRRRHDRRAHGGGRRRRPARAATPHREFPQHFPRPGWVEHDPDDIWARGPGHARPRSSPRSTARPSPASASPTSARPSSCGTARRVGPATGRSCGRTAAPRRAATTSAPPASSRCTGAHRPRARPLLLGHQARVAAARGRRRRRRRPRVRHRRFVGAVEPAPAVHATEPSNASRTMLFDIDARDWSDELLELFGVPRSCLPDGATEQRALRDHRSRRAPPGSAVPVLGHRRRPAGRAVRPGVLHPGHDQEHLRHRLVRARQPRRLAPAAVDGLLTTVAWQLGDGRRPTRMEGSIFVTGAAVQWLRDGLGIIERVVGSRTARRERARHRRRRVRPRVHGARLAVLRPVRARRGPRAHARDDARAPRARGRRGDGVADRRRRRRHHRGSRHPDHRAARRRRRRARWTCCASSRPTCWGSRCGGRWPRETTVLGAASLAGHRRRACGRHRPKRRRRGGRTPRSSPPRSPAPTNGGPTGVAASTGPHGPIPTPDGTRH